MLPSLGMLAFFAARGAVLAHLDVRRASQHRGYGSPPLAIRTGLIAASLTPLLVALVGRGDSRYGSWS